MLLLQEGEGHTNKKDGDAQPLFDFVNGRQAFAGGVSCDTIYKFNVGVDIDRIRVVLIELGLLGFQKKESPHSLQS